jgi:hypothetical protein
MPTIEPFVQPTTAFAPVDGPITCKNADVSQMWGQKNSRCLVDALPGCFVTY